MQDIRKKISFFWFILVPLLFLIVINIRKIIPQLNPKEYQRRDIVKEIYYETQKNKKEKDNTWELKRVQSIGEDAPVIFGTNAILIDNNNGNILYEINSGERRPIASLVKIMTAVVALEHKNLDDIIPVSPLAAGIGENYMGLSAGEKYTLRELMYGMMLNSGNDSASAIAEGVAGNIDNFVRWMNMKSDELNLKDTHFSDPSGLNDSSYSTAADLAVLTNYALEYPEFREIIKTIEMEIPYSENHKYIYLYNQTNLLTTYPGVAGVKTGYTEEAGLCLVTYVNNEDRELIGVVLNSTDRKGDMIQMLDYGYSLFDMKIEHHLLD